MLAAPGPGILEPMTWGWLNSPAVHLVGFIASVAAIGAIIWPVARKVTRRRSRTPGLIQVAPRMADFPDGVHRVATQDAAWSTGASTPLSSWSVGGQPRG